MNRRLTLTLPGIVLVGAGIWLVVTNVSKCLSESYPLILGSQCPAAYIGLSVVVLLTLGLTSLAISLSR